MSAHQAKSRRLMKFLLLGAILMLAGCGTQVPSGYHGVKYFKFGGGTEMGRIYPEGFQWHLPWNSFYLYNTRISENQEVLTVLSSDGATITLEVSVWHRPIIQFLWRDGSRDGTRQRNCTRRSGTPWRWRCLSRCVH